MNDTTPGKPLRVYNADGTWRDFGTDEFIGQKLNYLKGWACGMGAENLFINADGDIYGASCYQNGVLGNVWTDFKLPTEWQICGKSICSCGADLFIPKAKTLEEASVLRKSKNLPTIMKNKSETLNDGIVAMERVYDANCKQIHWEIGRRCNYNCSYCWPDIHNNYERHKNYDELITATKKIQEQFIGEGKCNFIITGGEPTANSAFLDWCRYINKCGYHLSMHSNGSRLPAYYKELIKYGDLNLSAHYESWDPEKFLKVVEAVTKVKVAADNQGVGHLEVKIMMKPNMTQYTLDFEERLKKIPRFVDYCTWAIVPIKDINVRFVDKNKESENFEQIVHYDGTLLSGYTQTDYNLFGDRNGK